MAITSNRSSRRNFLLGSAPVVAGGLATFGFAGGLCAERVQDKASPGKGKMWMAAVEPDTSKPGLWNTSIYFVSNSNEEVWKLTFVDQQGAGVKWLSEKLVFGQAWWGRIYATEFVLDIQQHKFIYMEMANYGAMTEPCE